MSDKCLQLRVEYFRCLSEFRSNEIYATIIQMAAARSAYTKCVRIGKRNYDIEYTQRLTWVQIPKNFGSHLDLIKNITYI